MAVFADRFNNEQYCYVLNSIQYLWGNNCTGHEHPLCTHRISGVDAVTVAQSYEQFIVVGAETLGLDVVVRLAELLLEPCCIIAFVVDKRGADQGTMLSLLYNPSLFLEQRR